MTGSWKISRAILVIGSLFLLPAVDVSGQKAATPSNDMAIIVNFPEKPILIPTYRSLSNEVAHWFDWNRDGYVMVSHTGIILCESETGQLLYFDFGRYNNRNDLMGPRPEYYGTVRSVDHVPELELPVKAKIEEGMIANLDTILIYLAINDLFDGYGRIDPAVIPDLNFERMVEKAREFESFDYHFYGAPFHLYCTSFVRKVLFAGGFRFTPWIFTGQQTINFVRRKFIGSG